METKIESMYLYFVLQYALDNWKDFFYRSRIIRVGVLKTLVKDLSDLPEIDEEQYMKNAHDTIYQVITELYETHRKKFL